MIKKSWSVVITMVLCGLLVAALLVMIVVMPALADWYYFGVRHGASGDGKPLLIAFYLCVPGAFFAIYHLLRLMHNIYKNDVFILRNVTHLRCLAWSCGYVAAVTFVVGVVLSYLPLLIISFAALFFCLCIRVIRHVMAAAVEIKTENELTI